MTWPSCGASNSRGGPPVAAQSATSAGGTGRGPTRPITTRTRRAEPEQHEADDSSPARTRRRERDLADQGGDAAEEERRDEQDDAGDEECADVVPIQPVDERLVRRAAVMGDAPVPRLDPIRVGLLHLRKWVERRARPDHHEQPHEDRYSERGDESALPSLACASFRTRWRARGGRRATSGESTAPTSLGRPSR